jgi:hypothetical protein
MPRSVASTRGSEHGTPETRFEGFGTDVRYLGTFDRTVHIRRSDVNGLESIFTVPPLRGWTSAAICNC